MKWRSWDCIIKSFIGRFPFRNNFLAHINLLSHSNRISLLFKRPVQTKIQIEVQKYILFTEIRLSWLVAERKSIIWRHSANWYKWKSTVTKNTIRGMREWQIIMRICSDYSVLEPTFPAACQLKNVWNLNKSTLVFHYLSGLW